MDIIAIAVAIHSQAISLNLARLSARRPPIKYPTDRAAIIVPITLVQTYTELPIVGANMRAAISSYDMRTKPDTKDISSSGLNLVSVFCIIAAIYYDTT